MRRPSAVPAAARDRRRGQAGVTLMELLLVVGITGMILVPVMAWSITALDREANSGIDADTAAFAQLNRFLTPDVSSSYVGFPGDPIDPLDMCTGGVAVTTDSALHLIYDESDAAPQVVGYFKGPSDEINPDTNLPFTQLVRRSCAPGGPIDNETIVADRIVGDVTVRCTVRPRFRNAISNSPAVVDNCGEVAVTLQGEFGDPVTLRASRQVDPLPNPVPGSRPIPVIACTPACPAVGTREFTMRFDGTLSSDRDPGGITGWAWDFGDGTTSTNARPTHTFTTIGTFNVTLTVANASGGIAQVSTTVTVNNAQPTAIARPNPMTAFRNQSVQFDGSLSSDSDGSYGPGLDFLWNFGDGTTANDSAKPWHTYTGSFMGQRDASLTVNDGDAQQPKTSSVQIPVDVQNSPPQFNLTATPPPTPCDDLNPAAGDCIRVNDFPIQVSMSAVNPANGQLGASDLDGSVPPNGYKWDIRRKGSVTAGVDPRTLGNARTLNFTFNQNGVYTVTLEVTDNDLGRTIRSIDVVVNKRPTVVIAPERCVINVGQPATCNIDASASVDEDGTIESYRWDWGDGTVQTFSTATGDLADGKVRSHTYTPRPDFGTFDAVLTVTDNDGTQTSKSIPVKVNRPPVPVMGPTDLTAFRGLAFDFEGYNSTDPDGDAAEITYTWDFGDGTTGAGHTPDHVYTTKGYKTVTMTATDQDGGVATISRQLLVVNQPPVASIYSPGRFINGDEPWEFSASANPNSVDPDGTIVSYAWNFGDGTTASTAAVTHRYLTRGTFTVTLTVTDDDGATATDTITIKVNRAPTANFTTNPNPPTALNPPFVVGFDASSSTDPDGTIANYTWNFGDGTSGTGKNVSHTYTTRGTWTVTLTVDDGEGGIGTKSVTALVGINKLPVVVVTPTPAAGASFGQNVKPASWSFNPAGSNDPDGTIAGFSWDFGDGTPVVSGAGGALGTVSHNFTEFGTFTVRLTLTDNLGSTASKTVVVKVNQRPVASIAPTSPNPLRAGRGVPFEFDGLGSNDPDGTVSAYLWDFGDGGTSTSAKPSHTYVANGTYTVTLTVQDNNTPSYYSAPVTRQIIVDNSPPTARIVTTPGVFSPGVVVSNSAPFTVGFNASTSSDPDGTIVSYSWDFGDGTTATGVTASHTYATFGTYDVVLTVTDDSALSDTEPIRIRVNNRPVGVIDVVSGTPCAAQPPCTVTFDAANSYDPDGSLTGLVRWVVNGTQYGSGQWALGQTTFTHTFTETGNNNVTLYVQDNDGQQGTGSYLLKINRAPVAGFTTSPDPAILNSSPYTVSFNGGSPNSTDPDGTIASYAWDFGDGTTATGATPTKTYAATGSYTVRLTVTDNQGVTATTTKVVKANAAPVAVIGPATLDPKLNLPFTFDGSGSSDPDGTIASYAWNFGDGNTATGVAPTHTYTANGNNTVTLTVTDDNGRTHTTTRTLTVAPNVAPNASFVTDPASGRGDGAPVDIGFDASASADPDGQIVSWAWNFGDGATGSGETATHTYTAYGSYTATLTVTDNNGATAATTRSIRINQVPIPSLQTFPDPPVFNSGPYLVDFFAELSQDPDGTVASYDWDFGDGNTGTGTPATHEFADFGTYTVTLTVTDNDGATATATVDVKVNEAPVVGATYSPSDPRRTQEVSFEATGTYDPDGSIVLYQWNFGDGFIESGRTTTHTYTTMGDFTVTLTVVDNDGGQSTHTFVVTVGNADPTAVILPIDPVVDFGTEINFEGDLSSDPDGTIVSYEWDYGDGTTGTGVAAPHTYADYGTYPVTLTVTDNNGQTATEMIFAKVNHAPTAVIGDLAGLTRGIPFTFSSAGSGDVDGDLSPDGGVTYVWQFGDGTTATGPSPTHTYATNLGLGPYTILLTVTDTDGRQTQATATPVYLINQKPTATASAQRVRNGVVSGAPTGPAPLQIEFSGVGSGDPDGTIATYAWNFGDGQSSAPSATPTVRHTYTGASPGTKTATLTVTDNNGGTATATVNVTIVGNQPPTARFFFTQQSVYGGPVNFDAGASSDPDNEIVSYTWDYDTRYAGPTDADSGVTTSRELPIGFWTVRLTVTDESGATNSTTQDVWVRGSPNAPVLSYSGGGTFTWTVVPGAVEYRVDREHPDPDCNSSDATVAAHTTSVTLSGESGLLCDFWGNQAYTVVVQARNFGSGEWSVVSNSIVADF